MKKLIKNVKFSQTSVVVGESIRVDVDVTDPKVDVLVNGVHGAMQYLQFSLKGSAEIIVTATLAKEIEQTARKVKVRDRTRGEPPAPIIWSTMDTYQPRTVVFSIANAESDLTSVRQYQWDFGDGTHGMSERGSISHDYSDALDINQLCTTFHVRVMAQGGDGSVLTGVRTIAVFHLYAYNKTRNRTLTPRVIIQSPLSPQPASPTDDVVCSFTIRNLEDEELSFSSERHEWLTDEPENATPLTAVALNALAPKATASAERLIATIHLPLMDLRVPARSSVTVTRKFPKLQFTGDFFGVAIHLAGIGMCSKLRAVASAYLEVKLPMRWSTHVSNGSVGAVLSVLAKDQNLTKNIVTHKSLSEFVRRHAVAAALSPTISTTPAVDDQPLDNHTGTSFNAAVEVRPSSQLGKAFQSAVSPIWGAVESKISSLLPQLLAPGAHVLTDRGIVYGMECDPDNMPDDLPEGDVCQRTSEVEWRYVPGRILNAKKGDVLLSPGGGLIGQLLRQVSPPQYYSHCGIMTKNHIEVRNSTGCEEWLRDHPKGSFGKPTDGFAPAALKYLWPGTITLTIDEANYGKWLSSPENKPYQLKPLSFEPDEGNRNTLRYALVVKPPPFDETAQVRSELHSIANAAVGINGHYRFYCYTKPEIALDPGQVAGSDAGWAQGTLPTQCASFIWLAAQHAGVRLEGPGVHTAVGDLEPKDTVSGAEADAATLDGLYHYTPDERAAAAKWLYQTLHDEAQNTAGFWGTLFTDAPSDIANQICNTFASDWSETDAKDSDRWKQPGSANAVSPDNIMLWDAPGNGNQGQFRSVYGYVEELFYRPGTYAQVPIYRWKHVATRGTLTGRVVANADVSGTNVSLLGSGLQDVVVGEDGRFTFANVPSGDYHISAGLNIGGYFHTADLDVSIKAGATTDVTVTLQPPPEVNRVITINVEMTTDWKSVWAHSPTYHNDTRSVRLNPFNSRDFLGFDGSGEPRGHILFDIRLNADLSITVSWTAQEIDDEVEGEIKGGYTIPKDGTLNWSGLRVSNDDPIDADWTDMNFTIHNDLGSA
ncbi:MAG TPA: hypothetical protein VNN22_16125 [Verrucomicrobiae bacterium]|nr:hypothetical protein [Verrucomicrobiae bacterium]